MSAFLNDPTNEKSDKVEGAIGEFSPFHETFQYYAEGVSTSTAVLGPGWEDRLVVFENESTKPGRGLCLEPHDCVAAKLAAGREKDFEFAAALLREQLVDSEISSRGSRPLDPIDSDAAPHQLGESQSAKDTRRWKLNQSSVPSGHKARRWGHRSVGGLKLTSDAMSKLGMSSSAV